MVDDVAVSTHAATTGDPTAPDSSQAAAVRPGPLDGLRVLDLSTVLAGPLTAQVLGDYGADVIKVEHPSRGDSFRTHGVQHRGVGLWWKIVSRNKRCVAIDLKSADGAELLLRLVESADVVIENFRPGTLERWGVGWDAIHAANPRTVLVRVTGFGQDGPYRDRPGFGTLAEAMSGFAAVTGEPDGPPTLPPMGLADTLCGLTGVGAVMMALWHRDRPGGSGEGQVVDLSLLEPMLCAVGPGPTVYDQTGRLQQRTGNRSSSNAPRNVYRSSDGRWLAVSTSATSIAQRVLRLVGHPEVVDEPWFASAAGRAEHVDLLDGYVADWVAQRPADEVVAAFEAADAAVAAVYTAADVLADPQIEALDVLTSVEDDELGALRMQNVLFRMSATPGSIRHTGRALGADTDAVLAEAGVDPDRTAGLRANGVLA